MSIRRLFVVVSFLTAFAISLSAPLASTAIACDADASPTGAC